MKKISFLKAKFIASSLSDSSYPSLYNLSGQHMPEVAIVGRSNVGKSSLINHLLNTKIAKTSATPGKTQTLNFFTIDDQIALVDLPGYGYAKAPQELKKKWAYSIDSYLQKSPYLSLILLLIDIRRELTEDDIAFAQWSAHHRKPFILIFTKSDKVSSHEKMANTERSLKFFKEIFQEQPINYIHYSINDPRAKHLLIEQINLLLQKKT